MKTYRLKLKPKSSFLTPWQSDTIFGGLCWAMAWRKGKAELAQFLNEYKTGNPAFILSDGMPGDLLPAPAHLSLIVKTDDYQKAKNLKKIAWLKPVDFEMLRKGHFKADLYENIKPFKPFTTMHSSINRITGTTGDDGSLFELLEYNLDAKETNADYLSVYLKIREGYEDTVMSLFSDLSSSGYGAKKSSGKGSFELAGGLEEFNGFSAFSGANAFISLSNFMPAPDDPTEGYYKTLVKYGKLGAEYAFSGTPFKKPLLLLTTGSVFRVNSIKPFYGQMVKGVVTAICDIVQYGYAFDVPATV